MNTFGPINWLEYYSISVRHRAADERARKREAKAKRFIRPAFLPVKPCEDCIARYCHKSIDPDEASFCQIYGLWVSEAWRAVTGRLK